MPNVITVLPPPISETRAVSQISYKTELWLLKGDSGRNSTRGLFSVSPLSRPLLRPPAAAGDARAEETDGPVGRETVSSRCAQPEPHSGAIRRPPASASALHAARDTAHHPPEPSSCRTTGNPDSVRPKPNPRSRLHLSHDLLGLLVSAPAIASVLGPAGGWTSGNRDSSLCPRRSARLRVPQEASAAARLPASRLGPPATGS